MKLSRLEIFGFKSFLNRTVFQFGQGVISIVGPNGCGKSNIVDAIVWVLGERGTKSLRVKDMGDVIFHGSNGRKPVNIAEVSLELTDGDKNLTVKRRIYRDGTNEYFLNGNLVRLKDIQEVFLGTGVGLNSYAIIEQGRIESLIQMKPLERRVVIEEASGITRFEEKKRDALSRMEEVTANLDRVEDIHREITASFSKAELEWQRWKSYQALADKLHEIEKQILLDGYSKLKKRIGKIREKQEELDTELGRKDAERLELKKESDAKESEFGLTDNIVRQLEIDIKSKEKDMENRLLEIEYVRGEKKRLETQQNTLRERDVSIREQIEEQHKEIENKAADITAHGEELGRQEEEAKSLRETAEQLKTTITGFEKHLEEERTKLFVSMSRLTEVKNKITQIERLKQERQKREEKERAEKQDLKETLVRLTEKQKILMKTLDKEESEKEAALKAETLAFGNRETLRKNLEEERNVAERLKNEKRIKENFLKQLGGLLEGDEPANINAVKLINMIRVDETREKALERFFSHELEYFVLTDKDTASIGRSVKNREGNYIFFPAKGMFTLGSSEIEMNIHWINTIEEGLARIDNGEEGIFLNDTVYIDSRGFILSGKDKKRVDLKQFKEKLKLEKELKTITSALENRYGTIEELQGRFTVCDNEHRKAKSLSEECANLAAKTEKDLLFLEAQIKSTQERLDALESRIDLTEDTSASEIARLIEEKEEAEKNKSEIEAAMSGIKEKVAGIRKDFDAAQSKWHEMTIAVERKKNRIKALEDDKTHRLAGISKLQEEIAAGARHMEQTSREIGDKKLKIESLERDYDDLKKASQKDLGRFEELKTMLGNLHMEKQAIGEKTEALLKEIEKIKSRRENTDKDIIMFTEKENVIAERLSTTYGIENPGEVTVQLPAGIEEERETTAKEIAAMGEINFRAEKEYTELQERLVFLEKQKEDLQNAMDSLKKTITKIDLLTKELFSETFEKVNNAFKRFTDLLFKGGKGHLAIDAESGGIEMFAQPPGKKVLRMELLSGGEKALISLSLLLALMDTKPSPFSLMDEIDAPLDDANLMALLEIVRTMSVKTQIIFITHNRITMESSDTIYGITMEEEGVSKTVSVKL